MRSPQQQQHKKKTTTGGAIHRRTHAYTYIAWTLAKEWQASCCSWDRIAFVDEYTYTYMHTMHKYIQLCVCVKFAVVALCVCALKKSNWKAIADALIETPAELSPPSPSS